MIGDLTIAPPAEPARTPASLGTGLRAPASAPRAAGAGPADGSRSDPEQIEATRLKALLTDPAVRISTHRDDPSGHVVMTVQDRDTGDVVEQFPSDKLLRLYAALRESLVDEQA